MTRIGFVVAIMFLVGCVFAVNEALDEFPLLGRGGGSSGDYGIMSLWGNPAGLAHTPKYAAMGMYNNFWGISEYGSYCAGGLINTKYATGGLFFNYFGSADIYSEISAGAVLAKPIGRIVDIGIRARFAQVAFPEPYGSAWTILFDVGLQHKFSNRAAIGLYWQNPAQSTNTLMDYEVNELISFGLRYNATSWATVYADVQFPETGPGELYLGQQLHITRWLSISGGVGGRPAKLYIGAGFMWNDMDIAWSGLIHPELGMCNGGKLTWQKE